MNAYSKSLPDLFKRNQYDQFASDFPIAVNLYNLGVKKEKVQTTTL